MKSIKNKILMVVISGLLVITAVVSAIAVNMTHEIMHTDADRILNNVTLKEAAYINDRLGDIEKSVAIMEHYALSEIETINQLTDAEFLEKYIQKTKMMFAEIALNTSGIEGFFMRFNPRYTSSTTGYYNIVKGDGSIREMQVTDLSKYPANDVKNVGWYYTAVREGKPVWLEPYQFPGYEATLISYTSPVYLDSELVGVIGFDMNFSYLVEQVSKISVYENGYAVLFATDGKTPYNEAHVLEENKNPHTKATADLLNGMKLELRAEYKDIQRNIHPMLRKIVMAFLIVLFFAILYTIVVTHRIVRPLKQLTKAATEISSGLNDVKFSAFPVESKDEIGTLARVLTNTYEKIQEYTTYINALAYRDSLTGVKNSTAYAEAIAELNKDINHGNPQFGVLVADINNLKQTNDRYGHDVGNELIIHTAKILTTIFKTSSVFRIGGDEFAIVLKGADYENYHALLVRLDEACAAEHIAVNDTTFSISLARGVSIFDNEIDCVYEDVFSKADHAMYFHKEQSKEARSQ